MGLDQGRRDILISEKCKLLQERGKIQFSKKNRLDLGKLATKLPKTGPGHQVSLQYFLVSTVSGEEH